MYREQVEKILFNHNFILVGDTYKNGEMRVRIQKHPMYGEEVAIDTAWYSAVKNDWYHRTAYLNPRLFISIKDHNAFFSEQIDLCIKEMEEAEKEI